MSITRVSTGTSIAFTIKVDVDGVTEFTTKFFGLFLRQSTPSDDLRVRQHVAGT